jgi:hypothetical protein
MDQALYRGRVATGPQSKRAQNEMPGRQSGSGHRTHFDVIILPLAERWRHCQSSTCAYMCTAVHGVCDRATIQGVMQAPK